MSAIFELHTSTLLIPAILYKWMSASICLPLLCMHELVNVEQYGVMGCRSRGLALNGEISQVKGLSFISATCLNSELVVWILITYPI